VRWGDSLTEWNWDVKQKRWKLLETSHRVRNRNSIGFFREIQNKSVICLETFRPTLIEESFVNKIAHRETVLPFLKMLIKLSVPVIASPRGSNCVRWELSLTSGNTMKTQREGRRLKNVKNEVTSLNVLTKVVCRKFKAITNLSVEKLVDVATL